MCVFKTLILISSQLWQVWGEAARPTAESDRNAGANLT